jgi:hypothetical protein
MKKSLLVILAALLTSGAASAQFRYPETNSLPDNRSYRVKDNVEDVFLNVREGPGVQYIIMARIPAGMGGIESKNQCVAPEDRSSRHSFCLIEWHKFQGWVSSTALEPEGGD